jgi:hypothetical protein
VDVGRQRHNLFLKFLQRISVGEGIGHVGEGIGNRSSEGGEIVGFKIDTVVRSGLPDSRQHGIGDCWKNHEADLHQTRHPNRHRNITRGFAALRMAIWLRKAPGWVLGGESGSNGL